MSDRDGRDGDKGQKGRRGGGRRKGGSGRDGGDPSSRGVRLSGSNVGRVLRTAYDDALREPVPEEFKDLLGKLD